MLILYAGCLGLSLVIEQKFTLSVRHSQKLLKSH